MSKFAPNSAEELTAMSEFAADIHEVAKHIAPGYGLDPLDAAFSIGLTATTILFNAYRGNQEAQLAAADTFARASKQSMADMVSGAESASGAIN